MRLKGEEIFKLLGGRRTGPGSWMCHCPAHDDKTPSLAVTQRDNRALFHCHSGCSQEEVRDALRNLTGEFKPRKDSSPLCFEDYFYSQRIALAHRNEYCVEKDISPINLRQTSKALLVPMFNASDKMCGIEEIPSISGGKKKQMKGSTKKGSFYQIGKLSRRIYITEGFADAQTIHETIGWCAVAAFGATNLLAVASVFKKRAPKSKIIIAGDNDEAGQKAACEAARATSAWIALPAKGYKDFNEQYTEEGKQSTLNSLKELTRPTGLAISVSNFIKTPLPRPTFLLAPILTNKSLAMIHAYRGVGKTYLALEIAVAVASGTNFLKWKATHRPQEVLYVDGEMPAHLLRKRLKGMTGRLKKPNIPLRLITPDYLKGPMPNIGIEEGRALIESELTDRTKLLVLDNLSTLFRTGTENDAESWQPVQDWLVELRRRGIAVLLIHHSGKSKLQRGTSKREDILDTVMTLKIPENYSADEGARFIIEFEKSRTLFGKEAMSFEVSLEVSADNTYAWKLGSGIPQDLKEVHELSTMGMTQQQIADKRGINQSTVARQLKKLERLLESSQSA